MTTPIQKDIQIDLFDAGTIVDDIDPGQLLTPREVAKNVNRDERTVQRWIKSGELPTVTQDGVRYVRSSDLADFLRNRWQATPATTVLPATDATDTMSPMVSVSDGDINVGDNNVVSSVSSPQSSRALSTRATAESPAVAQALAALGATMTAVREQVATIQETSYRAGAAEATASLLAQQLAAASSERDDMRDELARLRAGVSVLNGRLQERDAQLADARSELKTMSDSRDYMADRLSSLVRQDIADAAEDRAIAAEQREEALRAEVEREVNRRLDAARAGAQPNPVARRSILSWFGA